MAFPEIPGSQNAVRALLPAIKEGRLPHAVILEGAGRAELAAALARTAVCTGEDKPCGVCAGCVKALAGSHPDIREAGGQGAARSFHVDEVRALRSDAYIRPNEAPCKAYILREAQNMSDAAQNAILKVLEEPPENVLFILTVESAAALLPTVRSRAQCYSLDSASDAPQETELLAKLALAVTAPGETPILALTAPLIKDKERLDAALAAMTLLFRDACVLRAGGTDCLSGSREAAAALGASLTRGRLLALLGAARAAQKSRTQNANAALLVTALCAELRRAAGR